MKKIIIPFVLLASAMAMSSCEDFLTKSPQASLSPDTYFSSEKELDLWANKFYSDILPNPGDLAELNADDNGSSSSLSAVQKGTRTPSSKSWSADTWKPLRNINYMLENNKCTDVNVRNRYDGVCYFFRALFYFEKVRQYGDIPWYDHVIGSSDTEDLNKPRDPRGYVMLMVMKDLDKAYDLLPARWPSDAVYHVSKDAALALKSRAALFEGTFRKYHKGSVYVPVDEQTFDGVNISSEYFLQQAAEAAGKIVGTRKLYKGNTMKLADAAKDASYREYFILEDAETDETIFARRYNVDLKVRHGLQFDFKNQHRSASLRQVNHYLQSDGTPIQNRAGWQTLSYFDVFQDRDPRLAQTIQGPGYLMADIDEATKLHKTEQLSWERTFNGFRIIKYISDTGHEGATTSTTDYPLIRYAEVLLNYAEAKAELGQLTDEDIARTINVIRDRVGMPAMASVPSTPDALMESYYPHAAGAQKAAILEIRRERAVELFCEGFRQWDMLRWGEGALLTPKATGGFQGIYIAADQVGVDLDLDKDGKADLYLYTGSKGSTKAPATNQIQLGSGFTLSEGTSGYLTYWAAEDYVWNEDRDYLWPIPADQRTLTEFALTQNPGWDDGLSQ
ncbi:MAG: RagB/SusD family nutrient uptake outer membrane protein [Bacteroidales bacterium]|nr:RagB/SusD family nutrient uptake outer membrane protein [Bacteroidales bacterium]